MKKRSFIFFLLFLTTLVGFSQELPLLPILSEDATEAETKAQIDTVQSIARSEFFKRNYDKALQYSRYGISLTHKYDHVFLRSQLNSVIGNTLIRLNDTIRAKELFQKSIKDAELRKDTAILIGSRINLGNIYSQQKNFSQAIGIFKKTIPLAEINRDTTPLFILHYNIQELYLDQKKVEDARYHLDKCAIYIKPLRRKEFQSGFELSLGRLALLENRLDTAIAYFKSNIAIAKETEYIDGILDGYTYYLEALEKKEDYKQIFTIRKEYDVYRAEKLELDKVEAIDAETAYLKIEQYEERLKATQLENELTKQKASTSKTLLYYVLVGAGILGFSFVMLLRSYRKRQRLFESLKNKNREYLEAKVKSERLSHERARFFSNMSHELRTPLYGIIGISSLLLDDDALVKHKEDVKSLKFSADYLLALINDVLQLNKLDATKNEQLARETFVLKELVDNILTSFEFMRAHNNNYFEVIIDSKIPKHIQGDRVKLSQILMNLIGNACKFTENGMITLKIDLKESKLEKMKLSFCVKDTGLGISEEKQKYIFNEFAQESHNSTYEGTGLGLPIVKKLLELHDSSIKIKSELGVGTQFDFSIWYDIANEQNLKVVHTGAREETTMKGKRILIVDDNRINRIVTQKILDRQKALSHTAENGKEAIKAVQENSFDLVLMDINMPEMNGIEAAHEIRKFNTSLPIIALTAVEVDEMQQNISASGMNDIIVKPYDVTRFVEIILEHI